MSISSASIYRFIKKKKILIHSDSQTINGPSIASPPYIWLDEATDQEYIAMQILYALSCAKKDLLVPKDWAAADKEYLAAIGLEKMSEFYKDCQHVGILLKNNSLTFTPMINLGRKGFVNVPKAKIEITNNQSFNEIVDALYNAFNKCE